MDSLAEFLANFSASCAILAHIPLAHTHTHTLTHTLPILCNHMKNSFCSGVSPSDIFSSSQLSFHYPLALCVPRVFTPFLRSQQTKIYTKLHKLHLANYLFPLLSAIQIKFTVTMKTEMNILVIQLIWFYSGREFPCWYLAIKLFK